MILSSKLNILFILHIHVRQDTDIHIIYRDIVSNTSQTPVSITSSVTAQVADCKSMAISKLVAEHFKALESSKSF